MEAYERIMAILEGKKGEVDRMACMNSVSTATREFMKQTDAFWPESHKDAEKMAKLGSAAHRLCGLDNVTVPFDMTVEAEVFGSPIDFREKAAQRGRMLWPMSKRFLIEEPSHIYIPDGFPRIKRVVVIEEAIKILKGEFEGKVPVNVFMVPPFTSLSSYLVDTIKFMMWTKTDPQKVHQFMNVATELFTQIANVYAEAGADIVTLHEMGGSMDNVSPQAWKEFILPYLKKMLSGIKCKTILNICGRTEGLIEMMVECGADAIAIDERTSVARAREKIDSVNKGYPLIGNIASKAVIDQGTTEKIKESVKRVIEEGVDIVAPGCDFWIETPTEKIKTLVDAVVEFGGKKSTTPR